MITELKTKADVSKKHGQDTDQDVDNTVRQASGKEPTTAKGTPDRD